MRVEKLLDRIRKRARKKKIDYDLDLLWLIDRIQKGRCEYTGIKFKLEPHITTLNPFYPSIDRIDSNKGYTKDNCKVVIIGFNNLKGANNIEEVNKFCKGLVEIYEKENLK